MQRVFCHEGVPENQEILFVWPYQCCEVEYQYMATKKINAVAKIRMIVN